RLFVRRLRLECPSMIEDVRNVDDSGRIEATRDLQEEIPVMAAVEVRSKTSVRNRALTPKRRQMANIVLAEKECWVPVGFEVRGGGRAVLVEPILVGVHKDRVRVSVQDRSDHEQRVCPKDVRLVEQRDEFASRQPQRRVQGAGAIPLLGYAHEPDTWFAGGV